MISPVTSTRVATNAADEAAAGHDGERPDGQVEGRQRPDEEHRPPFRKPQLADAEWDFGIGVILPTLDLGR